ncbi:MAG: DUF3291 domain-containing protein [Actinomycetota bacterium]|nr:DUF3291 domain-containing protein [Actinomycetota bacterium]
MNAYELAQVNIGLPVEALDSARLADFVAQLEPVNALADGAPGFLWRLQTEDGDATAIRAFADDRLIVNMSVWESLEALATFVYRGEHAQVMRRRREWFVPMREAFQAAWWVPRGHRPTVAEAQDRLDALRADGPSPWVFTLQRPFPAPDRTSEPSSGDDWFCPA